MLVDLEPGSAAVDCFMDLSRLSRGSNDRGIKIPCMDRADLDRLKSENEKALPRLSAVPRAQDGSFAPACPSDVLIDSN
jgi:hypothetical protein